MQDIEVTETGNIRLAVAVSPFQPDPQCPMCANDKPSRLMNFCRKLRGESTLGCVGLSYCRGSRPLTQPVPGIQAMISGVAEMENPCAGVERAHLHVSCGRCGYRWFMECASAA